MRILVVSDSHGDPYRLKEAVERQPSAKLIIHLGDGARDLDYINARVPVISVKGNCDFGCDAPLSFIDEVKGKRIYCTHGHYEYVKHSLTYLKEKAAENGIHIALYGHTHEAVTLYEDGIWFINPGSVREGSYAVIDITDAGIMPIIMSIGY